MTDFTYHHSINVCLLATAAASRVIADKEFLRRVSLAALLHDVGKNEVPAEIIYKNGNLTPSEDEVLKERSRRGAEILLSTPSIDPLCVSVAFSHHMHEGPGSYPQTRNEYECDWISRLISVVDIYEALTAIRPYKMGLAPKTAFKIMLSMPGLKDRRKFIKLLYDCVGPYPKGTLVELTTGERGVVIEQNYTFPKLPKSASSPIASSTCSPIPSNSISPMTPRIRRKTRHGSFASRWSCRSPRKPPAATSRSPSPITYSAIS